MHDAPLANDKAADFYFDDFAATLVRLIASPATETPLAIGINGAWGSGKTSLLLRVKGMLDQPKASRAYADGGETFRVCKTVWFDAWKYNDEDKLLVALVRVILQAMRHDGFMNKLKAWFEDPRQSSYDVMAMFINAFEASFGGLGAEFKFKLDPKKHEQPSPFEKYTAFFDYFDEAFNALLKSWVGDDGVLVVFIDDLDRCLPAKTVQTLEAIKLFLDKSGCVFVLGADTRIVQTAVEKHYENAGITGESAKDYLEKVIQIRFDIPPIVEKAMEDYLKEQDKSKVDEVMLKRWGALVAAAEVNPRRVKNVINDLNLQWYMAVNSGQAEGVNKDDFICWQALMRAAPAKFATQIMDIEDVKLRHNFLMDALRWQKGAPEEQETVRGFFKDYEARDSRRLRGVLKQVSFSEDFTPEALDSMIYLSAPPQKPAVEPKIEQHVPAEKKVEHELVEEFEQPSEADIAYHEMLESKYESGSIPSKMGVTRESPNRLTIGGIEFVMIPKGSFLMGSRDGNELAFDSEKPQHSVDLTYDFWMARFILTNEQYAEFLGNKKHPVSDWLKKKDHPVVSVYWDDAMAYCIWFNETFKSELGDLLLRLPTEAEWEKAARGTYANEWPWGNDFDPKKCNSAEGGREARRQLAHILSWAEIRLMAARTWSGTFGSGHTLYSRNIPILRRMNAKRNPAVVDASYVAVPSMEIKGVRVARPAATTFLTLATTTSVFVFAFFPIIYLESEKTIHE
jgi:hypothetical protein